MPSNKKNLLMLSEFKITINDDVDMATAATTGTTIPIIANGKAIKL